MASTHYRYQIARARRPRRGDDAACLVGFLWADARVAYSGIRWMTLVVLSVAGWGLWYQSSHGVGLDPVTLAAAVGSAAVGLLRPSALRAAVNSGAPVAGRYVAASTPAPSERPTIRAAEAEALAIFAVACAAAAHAAQDRVRAIVARVLAARSAITETIQPRLAASMAAAVAAPQRS